jgi:hypothetical protein
VFFIRVKPRLRADAMAGRLVVLAVCLMITGASSSRPSTSSLRPASVVSPVLSEFVAKNERGILDEDGRSSDYLLLRNPAREWCAGPTHDERRRVRLTPTEWRTTGASATPLRPVWVYAQSRLPLQGFALTVTRSAGDGVSPSAWPFPEVRRTRLRRTAAHGTTGSPVVNALYAHSRLQRRSIERGKGTFRVCSNVSVRTLRQQLRAGVHGAHASKHPIRPEPWNAACRFPSHQRELSSCGPLARTVALQAWPNDRSARRSTLTSSWMPVRAIPCVRLLFSALVRRELR